MYNFGGGFGKPQRGLQNSGERENPEFDIHEYETSSEELAELEQKVVAYDRISRHVLIENKKENRHQFPYEWQPAITLMQDYRNELQKNPTHAILMNNMMDRLHNKILALQKKDDPCFIEGVQDIDRKNQLWNLERDLPEQYGFPYDRAHPFIGYIPSELTEFNQGFQRDMIIYCIKSGENHLFGMTDYDSLKNTLELKKDLEQDYKNLNRALDAFVEMARDRIQFLNDHLKSGYIMTKLYEICFAKIVDGNFFEQRPALGSNAVRLHPKILNDPVENRMAVEPHGVLRSFLRRFFLSLSQTYCLDQYNDEVIELTQQCRPELYHDIMATRMRAYKM